MVLRDVYGKFIKGSKGHLGYRHSEESKEKNRKAHLGKKFSDETKERMGKKARKGEKSNLWKGGMSFNKKYRNWQKNQRNKIKKANGGIHTYGEWETLKAQYNWTCPSCKRKEPEIKLTEDHIIPLSKGGSDNIDNIQPLCKKCNFQKHTKVIKYKL